MDTTRACSHCGQPLAADAPQGLCPACLLQGAFPTGTDSGGAAPRFQPPTLAELAPKFPQLDILSFVGQGGMGAVYQARQKELDRIVALKILPPDIGQDAAFAERFMREARALARLNHPGIVTIHDFGRADGLYFFLMEFVDGVSLRQLLGSSRLSTREALAIVPQICDALQYAHDQGIIHRDIKPENILLDRRGRVKVADFGLAKIVAGAEPAAQPPAARASGTAGLPAIPAGKPAPTPVLTDSGKVLGTPSYMSPEQSAHPGDVDHRADIYALGVVFYQMLTGELPGRKLEPPSHKVEIDVRLDEVVLRALERKPERRYQQVSEVKSRVESIRSTLNESATPAPAAEASEPSATRHRGALLAGATLAGVLALLFWRSFRPGELLFSNDHSLGQIHAAWMRLPDGLTGRWADLNYLGFNGGSYAMSFTTLLRWLLGPLGSGKFLAPVSLGLLGSCAWLLFRRLGLARPAALLAALAVTLNSTFLSLACWGITENVLGLGMNYLALGLVLCGRQTASRGEQRAFHALAGLATGVGILEASVDGFICSLLLLAYVLWGALAESGPFWQRLARGIKTTLWVIAFIALMAGAPLISAFSSFSASGDGQAKEHEVQAKAAQWNWATQWSLPKKEAAALVVPGLFGFRMDTPDGGQYWGGIGRAPELDAWLEGDRQGPEPSGPSNYMRFSGGGNYLGVVVALVALWAAGRALRRDDTVFTVSERKLLWFWMGTVLVCLLLAFGRFAPFYRLAYALPFFSTFRNPARFLEPMILAMSILFAYGLLGLWRQYLAPDAAAAEPLGARLKTWWQRGDVFDRRWAAGCGAVLGLSLAAWPVYAASQGALRSYLGVVGFSDGAMAQSIAAFSVRQVGWFVLFFLLGAAWLVLILSQGFAGPRRRWAGWWLGLLLVADLGRSSLPWIMYSNYPQRYAANDVLRFLREKPFEHRVAQLPFQTPPDLQLLNEVYAIEWIQHQFPYYDIQSLDIVQLPRMPKDMLAYETALAPKGDSTTLPLLARRWQLTGTRYLLGPAAFLDDLNRRLDPDQRRFRIARTFAVVPAGGVAGAPPAAKPGAFAAVPPDQLTAIFETNAPYAIFEFTGALPRAALYTHWQVSTNDPVILAQLASLDFDPLQTVLVDGTPSAELPAENPGGADIGSVEFVSYAPKEIVLSVRAKAASVLLLNDRFDPQWKVMVDGRMAALLRCNYLMRGVAVPAGEHTVRFSFQVAPGLPLPHLDVEPDTQAVSLVFPVSSGVTSYVTLGAYGVGLGLVAVLVVGRRVRRTEKGMA